jgi:type IV secretion system protein VirB5
MTRTDHVGNAAHAARFEFFAVWRRMAIAFLLLFAASAATNVWQSRRPPVLMVVRVDEAGRSEAIRYRNNDYTPKEAEIVAGLNTWAIDRFRLIKTVIDTNFKANYYFLDSRLARELTTSDADVVASVQAAKIPEQDVQINSITFDFIDTTKLPDGTVGAGQCKIDMYKFSSASPQAREHWLLTLRYKVNPLAAAERSGRDPAFQLANPLGLTITWFHEDRAQS